MLQSVRELKRAWQRGTIADAMLSCECLCETTLDAFPFGSTPLLCLVFLPLPLFYLQNDNKEPGKQQTHVDVSLQEMQ